MNELISVIIPVHNSSKYLSICLESILKQTYKNIEIIAVENGSTDNSLEILNKYKETIKIEVLKEAGLSKARNKGIEISSGKYLVFIDSDDEVEDTFIEDLYKNLNINKSDISICDIKEIHEETNKIVLNNLYPTNTIEKQEILNNLEKFNHGPCNKLFKKEIIEKYKIRFPKSLKYEDVPFVLEYLVNSNKVSKVNQYLYIYKIHKDSEQTTIDNKIFDIIKIMNLCLEITEKKYLEDLYISILTTYALKTRYIKNNELRNKFINETYKELNKNYPNWRKSKYIKSRPLIKQIIQKNKLLVKIYACIYKKQT